MEADLHRIYGLDLDDMYAGTVRVLKVANLVKHLPRGSAVWEMVGGHRAVTAEVESLWAIEHAIVSVAHAQGGGKGQAPKPRQYPEGILSQRSRAERKSAREAARARRFEARMNRTE